jgi:hypothetical protein
VIVFDVNRTTIAKSPSRRGLANRVGFEPGALIYRRSLERSGDQELRLQIDSH